MATPTGSTPSREDWSSALAEVPLFAGLSDQDVRAIARLATVESVSTGSEIVHLGDPGNSFYLVLEGAVVVRIPGKPDAGLTAGGHFGELALLVDGPRSGTVEATEETRLARIGRTSFLTMLEQEPKVALRLLRTLADRLRATEAGSTP